MTKFAVFDVFTETAFGGNQLAVISDASALPEKDLQAIAREFNFSETTFVYPPEDDQNTARVRIFTPTNEIPFAGHPTIGTAIALARDTGVTDLRLELGVGTIPCKVTLGNPSRAEFTTSVPLRKYGQVAVDLVADCLGIAADKIVTQTHLPVIASVGLPHTMVELEDAAYLAATSPVTDHFKTAEKTCANDIDMFAIYAYVRQGNEIKARMFAPLNNIPEDPATGSAAAALGALLSNILATSLDLSILQGVEMGRPSKINVITKVAENGDCSVTIGGSAVETMRGELVYEVSTTNSNA